VTDGRGAIKLQVPAGQVAASSAGEAMKALDAVIARNTHYGDAGAQVPAVHVVAGRKIIDLSALPSADQMMALAREDLGALPAADRVFFIVKPHG
jgi:hypothetical protein